MVARRGLGLITSSNFFVPQVNLPGSMASFVTPAAIPISAIAAKGGKTGLGWLHRWGLGQDDSPVYAPANLTATWSDATTGKALGQDASGTIWDLETGKPLVAAVPSILGQSTQTAGTSTWNYATGYTPSQPMDFSGVVLRGVYPKVCPPT